MRSIQISQVPALAVLVVCSSPIMLVLGLNPVLQRLSNLNYISCTEEVFCVQTLIMHEKLDVGVHLSVTELLLCQQIADVVDKELVQPFEILFEGVEYIARAGWTPEGK